MTELIEENKSSVEMYATTTERDENVNPQVTNETFREQRSDGIRNGGFALELADTMVSLTDITLEDAVTKIREIEQANLLLRDYLRKNNEEVKRQYESLITLKRKEKEKFDQTKAVITALRKENEEMQMKLMEKNDSISQLEKSLEVCNREDSKDITDAVVVSVESQESMIAEFKNTIATNEDYIIQMQQDVSKHKEEIKSCQESSQQLLKDLESQQELKAATDEENRVLNQELVELKKKLHEQMHIQLSMTKRELEVQHGQKTSDSLLEASAEEHLSSQSMLTPESLDDLIEKAQSMEEAKYDDAERMKALLEKETLDKQDLEQKIQELTEKVKELTQQNNEAKQKIVNIEIEKSERINELCRDYEAKLTEKAKENLDQKEREPANTEDSEVLRSQILSLIKEVQEAEGKHSDLTRTIQHKDDRIKMLSRSVDESEQQRQALSHEHRLLMEHLQVQINAQRRANEDKIALQQNNRQLQVSFDKLIADNGELMNLVETYKAEMDKHERARGDRNRSSQDMEEMNRLAAEVIAAEEALTLKDDQLKEIGRKFSIIQEEIELLRIQAETYKGDFSCERDARTKLAQEKSELLEALQKCQEENLTYKEQLRDVHQQQYRELQGRLQRPPQEAAPSNYVFPEEQQGVAEAAPLLNDLVPVSAASRPPANGLTVGEVSSSYQMPHYPSRAPLVPQTIGHGPAHQSYGLTAPPHMAGIHPNMSLMSASTLPPSWYSQITRQGIRYPPVSRFQAQEHEPIRLSQEEVGDGDFSSLAQYECPSCGAQFPDMDTLNLHVPDCISD